MLNSNLSLGANEDLASRYSVICATLNDNVDRWAGCSGVCWNTIPSDNVNILSMLQPHAEEFIKQCQQSFTSKYYWQKNLITLEDRMRGRIPCHRRRSRWKSHRFHHCASWPWSGPQLQVEHTTETIDRQWRWRAGKTLEACWCCTAENQLLELRVWHRDSGTVHQD